MSLAVKETCLKNCNPLEDSNWHEFEPGRLAKLALNGPNGALDLYVCYFPTGSTSEEDKRQLIRRKSDTVAPKDEALTLLMGDWNFVMRTDDRFCLRTLDSTLASLTARQQGNSNHS